MIIGIIGGGQLGMMMAMSAIESGHTIYSYDESESCSIVKYSKCHTAGKFTDFSKLYDFCKQCDVVTYEFENIDLKVLEQLENSFTIYPNSRSLRYSQDRLLEKILAKYLNIRTTQFYEINSIEDIDFNKKSIIKTRYGGYDGKGQVVVSLDNMSIIEKLIEIPCIVEAFVEYKYEVSLIISRDVYGNVKTFPITKNIHKNGILHKSIVPVKLSEEIKSQIYEAGNKLAEYLDIVGTLCIEFFVDKNGILLNEIAPRPHNSGHHTIESCDISQFDQHINCITGQRIVEPRLLTSAMMINIMGEDKCVYHGGVVHMYGKAEARKNRKMGHVTFTGGKYE